MHWCGAAQGKRSGTELLWLHHASRLLLQGRQSRSGSSVSARRWRQRRRLAVNLIIQLQTAGICRQLPECASGERCVWVEQVSLGLLLRS